MPPKSMLNYFPDVSIALSMEHYRDGDDTPYPTSNQNTLGGRNAISFRLRYLTSEALLKNLTE